jgi:hypothetical protein
MWLSQVLTVPGFLPHDEQSITGDVLTLNGRARSIFQS